MKNLKEYLNESLNKSSFKKINGKLDWMFKSSDYGVDEKISANNWSMCTNGEIIAFFSPDSNWVPYFYASEKDRGNINWALVGNDMSISDPAAFCKNVLEDWDTYCMENATVPELEKVEIPGAIYKYIK